MNARQDFVGMVRDLSNADYHRHPALSKSQLADFLVAPAYYYGRHLAPDRPIRKETAGQRSGTLLHTLALEPHTVDARYRIGPDVSRTTKEWKAFMATVPPGAATIKAEEYAAGLAQAESLRMHAEIGELLSTGFAEASIFWIDPVTGLRCRCRPDWLHPTPRGWIVLDLKTGPATPRAFASQCARMTYDIQDAMYSEGIEIATGQPVLAFLFGVVELEAPHMSMCAEIDAQGRASARAKYRAALNRYAACVATRDWPGHRGIQSIALPQYAIASELSE